MVADAWAFARESPARLLRPGLRVRPRAARGRPPAAAWRRSGGMRSGSRAASSSVSGGDPGEEVVLLALQPVSGSPRRCAASASELGRERRAAASGPAEAEPVAKALISRHRFDARARVRRPGRPARNRRSDRAAPTSPACQQRGRASPRPAAPAQRRTAEPRYGRRSAATGSLTSSRMRSAAVDPARFPQQLRGDAMVAESAIARPLRQRVLPAPSMPSIVMSLPGRHGAAAQP